MTTGDVVIQLNGCTMTPTITPTDDPAIVRLSVLHPWDNLVEYSARYTVADLIDRMIPGTNRIRLDNMPTAHR